MGAVDDVRLAVAVEVAGGGPFGVVDVGELLAGEGVEREVFGGRCGGEDEPHVDTESRRKQERVWERGTRTPWLGWRAAAIISCRGGGSKNNHSPAPPRTYQLTPPAPCGRPPSARQSTGPSRDRPLRASGPPPWEAAMTNRPTPAISRRAARGPAAAERAVEHHLARAADASARTTKNDLVRSRRIRTGESSPSGRRAEPTSSPLWYHFADAMPCWPSNCLLVSSQAPGPTEGRPHLPRRCALRRAVRHGPNGWCVGHVPRRPHVFAPRRLHHRARRRAAAGQPPHRRRLRRAGPALRRRFVRVQRSGRETARGKAAPDRATGGRRRRRHVRQADRIRGPHDAAAGRHVARRLAVRRRAAEHLEIDGPRRRRGRRGARRVVSGQDARPPARTTCTAPSSAPTAGSTGARAPSPSRRTTGPADAARW